MMNTPARLVDRVGFGSGTMISQGFGAVDIDDAKAAVSTALDAGVRFFDTAFFYGSGRSELVVGEMLEGRRSQVRICTKGGVSYSDPTNLLTLRTDSSYEGLRSNIDESLRRLRTDHVDVYLLHQFDPALTPEEAMENLGKLQQEGVAEEVGFCNYGAEACRRALATGIPSVVEYSCSLLDRRYVNELRDAGERGCTRITFGSFVHGLLAEDFTPDHEFADEDWRGRSRRTGASGTSGNVFFAGDAFAKNVAVAGELRAIAARYDLTLAAFVLALSVREPESDIALYGCRNAREVVDGLSGLDVLFEQSDLDEVARILATADRPTENRLGLTG
jgi:aryl-alcohol dehydrogenase-like predicted oxidoreductase